MKKLNIKKVLLVVIVLIAIIGGIYFGVRSLFFKETAPKDAVEEQNNTVTPKVDNEFSHLEYYHKDKLERYRTYQQNNPNLSVEAVVTYVNMRIDVPFYSTDPITVKDADALDVLVNKVYKLPDDWAPSDLMDVDSSGQKLRKEAAEAYEKLKEACAEAGFTISVHSGYRSVSYQKEIYQNMISQYGEEYTDKYSSRPGQSEHNTGLCADISINGIHYSEIESDANYQTFNGLLEEYGFIIRYPDGKEDLTGYHYESWHIRYLGVNLAKKVNETGLTYDEYVARNEK